MTRGGTFIGPLRQIYTKLKIADIIMCMVSRVDESIASLHAMMLISESLL